MLIVRILIIHLSINFKTFKEWCITYKVIPLLASVSYVVVYISGLVQQSVSGTVL